MPIERRRLRNAEPPQRQTRRRPGRPGVYGPDKVVAVKEMAQLGATDYQMALIFGISPQTFYLWQREHPEFSEALKLGKELPDERVKRSLYHKAVGYTFHSEKLFFNKDADVEAGEEQVVRVQTIEHVPPSDTAAIFWLKNRDPANWRENHNAPGDQTSADLQTAQAQLLTRVFGVLERLSGGEAPARPPRTINAIPERRS